MSVLNIFFSQNLIGKLIEDRSGIGFQYSEEWLNYKNRFAISNSMPLSSQFYLEEAENFFGNLLPEGNVRENLCSKLGISIDNDMALLEKIGHECAGALVITVNSTPPITHENLELITLNDFVSLMNNNSSVYSGIQDEGFPFSLAGAQDKIPIIYKDNNFFKPSATYPSTHILKFAQDRFKYVPENELICSMIFEAFNLPVPSSKLVKINSKKHLLVERYDRKLDTSLRIHQEDFCQALGISHKKKYESDGEIDLKKIFLKLEEASNNLAHNMDQLIRWQILNVLIGNCDGHAKNLSLIMNENCSWKLAPFYDIVMTLIYPRISNKLAFSIGGQREVGNLHLKHWQNFFESIQVNSSWYTKQILIMCDELMPNFENIKQYFISEYGYSPVLDMMEPQLVENIRRVRLGLKF